MVIVNYFTCDKSTNVHSMDMVTVNYSTCDKSTNVHRMLPVNYFTCDKSTNVHRMAIVNYFTCDKSVQWVEKSLSQISNSELWARKFLICRILSMSSVLLICPADGWQPHPQVGAGIAVKRFLISLYNKVKSKSVETTATWPPESNIKDECSFSVMQYKKHFTHTKNQGVRPTFMVINPLRTLSYVWSNRNISHTHKKSGVRPTLMVINLLRTFSSVWSNRNISHT